jgi:hypothetical protein
LLKGELAFSVCAREVEFTVSLREDKMIEAARTLSGGRAGVTGQGKESAGRR